MREKLSLKSLRDLGPATGIAPAPPPKPEVSVVPPPPADPRPHETWVSLKHQWLKMVSESRPNRGKRLLRVDLYDADKETLLARFYRR